MNLRSKKIVAAGLAVALCVSGVTVPSTDASAAKAVKKVTLNKKKATLYKGAAKAYSKATLKVTVKPASKKKAAKWASSNKKVATVTKKGVVTAKKAGKATITVKAGNKKATCKVTVKKWVKVTKVTAKALTVNAGKSKTLKVTVAPKKASIKAVSYKSANKKVAKVTSKGKVTGVKAGTTKITVTAKDGSKKKTTVKVTVKAAAVAPSEEPSAEPTVAPSEEPSVEPTVAPSEAPSAEPTAAPSADPSAAPSATPSATPAGNGGSSAPSSSVKAVTPVEDKDIAGNVVYAVPVAGTTKVAVKVGTKTYDITSGAGAVAVFNAVVGKVVDETSVADAQAKFAAAKYDYKDASLISGATVTVKKDANSDSAVVTVDKGVAAGTYNVEFTADGKVTVAKDANNTVAGTVSNSSAAKEYKVTGLTATVAGKSVGSSDTATATVTRDAKGAVTSTTVVYGGAKFAVSKSVDNVSFSIPKQYKDKFTLYK